MLPAALLTVGQFLLDHADVVEEVAKAIAGGTPKDAIIAAIKGVQVKTSDDAIREELEAAEVRRSGAV